MNGIQIFCTNSNKKETTKPAYAKFIQKNKKNTFLDKTDNSHIQTFY